MPNEKTCPFCAETIRAAAVVCKHCQRDLPAESTPPITPEAPKKIGNQSAAKAAGVGCLIVTGAGLLLILLVICAAMNPTTTPNSNNSVANTPAPQSVQETSALTQPNKPQSRKPFDITIEQFRQGFALSAKKSGLKMQKTQFLTAGGVPTFVMKVNPVNLVMAGSYEKTSKKIVLISVVAGDGDPKTQGVAILTSAEIMMALIDPSVSEASETKVLETLKMVGEDVDLTSAGHECDLNGIHYFVEKSDEYTIGAYRNEFVD